MRAATSVLAVALLAAPAHAEPSEADRAFTTGRAQLAAGKYAEACASFQRSEDLDPQLGTRFNIAACDDQLGKLAPAAVIYRDLLAHDTNAPRRAVVVKLAADVEARVAHAHLHLSQPLPGGGVTVDGQDVTAFADDVPVDIGSHVVVVTASGGASKSTPFVIIAEPSSVDVAVDVPAPPAPAPAAALVAPPSAASPHRSHVPLVLVSAGGAAIAGGVVAGLLARSRWNSAQAAADAGDPRRGNQLASSATTRGDLSTGLFVLGGLAAAAGVGLYLRGEHTSVIAAPTSGGAAVSVSGRF